MVLVFFFIKPTKFFLKFIIFNIIFFLTSFNSHYLGSNLYNLNSSVRGISSFVAGKDFFNDSFGDSYDIVNSNKLPRLSNKYFDYTNYIYSVYKSAKNVTGGITYNDDVLKRLENNRIDIIKFFGNMNIQIKFNYCNFFKSLIDCVSLDVDNAFDKTTNTNIDEYISEHDMFQNVNSLQDIHNNLVSRGYLGKSNPLVKDELLNKYFEKFNEYYKNFKSICYKDKDDNIQVSDKSVPDIVFNSSNLVCYCNFMITLFSYIYSDPVFILNYVIKRFCELVIPDFSYNYSITEAQKKEKTKKNEEASYRVFDKLQWFSKIFDYCDENSSVDLFMRNEQEDECPSDSKLFELFLNYKNGPIQSMRCLSDIINKKKYLINNKVEFFNKIYSDVVGSSSKEKNEDKYNKNNAIFSFLRSYLDLFLVKLRYFYNFICWNKLFFKWAFFVNKSDEKNNMGTEKIINPSFTRILESQNVLFGAINKSYKGVFDLRRFGFFKLIFDCNSGVSYLNLALKSDFNGVFLEMIKKSYTLNFPRLVVTLPNEGSNDLGSIGRYFCYLSCCIEDIAYCLDDKNNKDDKYDKDNKDNKDNVFDKYDDIFDKYDDIFDKEGAIDTIVDRVLEYHRSPIIRQLESRVLSPKYLFYNGKFFRPYYATPLLELNDYSKLSSALRPSPSITPNYYEYTNVVSDFYHFPNNYDKYYNVFKDFCNKYEGTKQKFLNKGSTTKSTEVSRNKVAVLKLYDFYKYFKSRNNVDIFFARDLTKYSGRDNIADVFISYDLDSKEELEINVGNFIFEDIFLSCGNIVNVYIFTDFVFHFILEPFQKYKDMKCLLDDFNRSHPSLLFQLLRRNMFDDCRDLFCIFKNDELKLNWIKEYQFFYWNDIYKKYLPLCRDMLFKHINNLHDILNAIDLVLMSFNFMDRKSSYSNYEKFFIKHGEFNVSDLMEYLEKLQYYCRMWYDTFLVSYYYLTPVYVDDLVDYMKEYVESKSLNGVTRTLYQLVGTEFNFYDFYSDNEIKNLITKDLQDLQSKLEKNPNFDVVSYAKGEITTKLKLHLLSKINKTYEEASTKKPEKISKEALETFYNNCECAFNKTSFIEGLDKAIEERLIQYFREFVPVIHESNNVSDITYTDSGDKNLFDDKFVLGDPMFKEIISSVKRTPEYNSCVDQLNFLEDFVQLVQCEANLKVFDVAYSYIISNLKKSKEASHSKELLSYCKGLNLDDLQSNTNLPICILLDNINYIVLKCYHFYNFKKSDKVKEKYDYLFKKIEDSKQKLVKLKELANEL